MSSPIILCDSREKKPLTFPGLRTRRTKVKYGDYTVHGLSKVVAVERKGGSDWVGCHRNAKSFDRLSKQFETFCEAVEHPLIVVVEVSPIYLYRTTPWLSIEALKQSVLRFQQKYPLIYVKNEAEAAEWTRRHLLMEWKK